jgi:preprotein translocase subunit SecG
MDLDFIISLIQILVAVFLVVFVLLQQRGSALGSAFGGGDSGSFYSARRGIQKQLYWGTIILGTLFIGLALIRLLLNI